MRHKWLYITLGLLMLLLVGQEQRARAYEYDETPSDDEYEYATPEVITSTKTEEWNRGRVSIINC